VTLLILCAAQAEGSVHDFTLFKEDIGDGMEASILAKLDSGYQGVTEYHENSEIPVKKVKIIR
jgi:hypothetical protein